MSTTLYLHLPGKAHTAHAGNLASMACPFALVAQGQQPTREGVTTLGELAALRAQRVVVLLAACDITLLRAKIPPMPASKISAALPNLLEDRLLGNPAEWAIVASRPEADHMHTIAVADRAWLEQIAQFLLQQGIRHYALLPAQLCLPQQEDRITAALTPHTTGSVLALRSSAHSGLGLAFPDQQPDAALQALTTLAPAAEIALHVAPAQLPAYQRALSHADNSRIHLVPADWSLWISGADHVELDLQRGLRLPARHAIDWRTWSRPLVLAAALLVVNIAALNFDWWQQKREADTLRSSLVQIYRARFPNEPVIIDPVAQMQQKIMLAQHQAGAWATDDFVALLAAFGDAWHTASTPAKPAITALDYHAQTLSVTLNTASVPGDLQQQVAASLSRQHAMLSQTASPTGLTVWKIGSAP